MMNSYKLFCIDGRARAQIGVDRHGLTDIWSVKLTDFKTVERSRPVTRAGVYYALLGIGVSGVKRNA